MATRSTMAEGKKAATRARVQKHREKLYSNPELLEEYRRKERERYLKRKESGLLKPAKDMTAKQRKKQQKKWRENSNRCNSKRRNLQIIMNLTPPSGNDIQEEQGNVMPLPLPCRVLQPIEQNQPPPRLVQQTSTPKRKQTKSKLRSKLRDLEKKLKQKQRELECTRKRIRRLEENRGRANQAQKSRERLVTVSKRKRMGTLVETFLHRDDITTVINGKAGEIRKGGQIFRKRYLTDTMENLHKKFIGENPTLKLSRSQFCKHRPFWIVSPRVTDRETCGCKIHENFTRKVKKLHQLGITRTMSSMEVVASSVCNAVDIDCMYNRCDKCKKATFPIEMNPNTKDNTVSWKEWVSRSTPVTKKHQDGSTSVFEVKNTILEKKFASIERLVDLTKEDLPRFCTHLYNIRHQFTRLKMLKGSLTEDQVVVHVDYSENYNCKWSKEIKDTHFGGSHQQVTLHTGVLYFSGGKVESFATLSESLQHDAIATWAHLDPILNYVRTSHPAAERIHFLSDGPTSQYRNKTAFYLASTVPFLKGFKAVTWNFTEASHGKGAPDGVGGALKNLADRMVAYGTDIPDAHALMENLSKQTSVKLFEVTEEKITTSGELVPPSLKTVPGTMKVHQLVATEPGKIRTRDVSCFCSPSCDCFSPREFIFCPKEVEVEVEESHKEQDSTIEVGTWVLVNYDGDLYPGSVTQIVGEQYEVDTMSRVGENRFFVPATQYPGDKVWYYESDIKAVIPVPMPATSSARHFCVLPEIWAKYSTRKT